jgi:hypothetical protein
MDSADQNTGETRHLSAAPASPVWRRIMDGVLILVVCALIGVAVRAGWFATHDLQLPFDHDLFRDAASAQSMIDGQFPADPYYKGEQNWYNPLGPGFVALLSRVIGVPPVEFYARHGALAGIVIPLGFLILGMSLFGRWGGALALFAFLFLAPGYISSWAAPSYSPWLFANLISLVPFTLTLTTAVLARRNDRTLVWIACGLLLGATFLAHTASAVTAGCIVVALAWKRKQFIASVGRCAMILVAALVASVPFLVSIAGHYHLQVQNTAPIDYVFIETEVDRFGELLWNSLTLGNVAALAGFVLLFVRRPLPGVRTMFLVWILVAGGMFTLGYARQLWPHYKLPALVPAFHWLFQLRLAVPLLAGYALWSLSGALSALVGRGRTLPAPVFATAIMAGLLFFMYPKFAVRYDFTAARKVAIECAAVPGATETIAWMRSELPPDAVVLASPNDSLVLLGASGKKAVVLDPEFSNPYVPYAPRAEAAETLFQALIGHDGPGFRLTAAKYDVSFILLSSTSADFLRACISAPFVKLIFSSGAYVVLRLEPEESPSS